MIDLLLGGAALSVLVLMGLALDRFSQPKCKHQWTVMAKTFSRGGYDTEEHTMVLLACDECGATKEHRLSGAEK